MTSQRFQVARHLITTRPWKLFWMVDMGIDRLHHGFWHFMDPEHRRYEPHQPLEQAIHDYYVMIDQQIGGLLDVLDLKHTAVWIVSDHGGQRLDGGFCLNDWLIREGLLTMKTPVTERRPFELADVDWSRTKVWGAGGYVGQCFINRAGREPRGVMPIETYEDLRDALTAGIEALTDPEGRPLESHVYKPDELYPVVNGFPPDLIVHFGDLHWRAVSSIGHPDLFTYDHEAGPDDANHSHRGLYILSHGTVTGGRRDATLYDVAPTTLDLMGLNRPRSLCGHSLVKE